MSRPEPRSGARGGRGHGLIFPTLKPTLALILTLVAACPVGSLASDAGVSNGLVGPQDALFRQGMWWDPNRDGSGWDIGRSGDHLFAIWYTYDDAGDPIWYTASGRQAQQGFQGDLLKHQWNLATDTHGTPEKVGTLEIAFPQAQRAVVNWRIGSTAGTRELQPFRFAAEPTLEDYSGTWYDPRESGYGITVQTQADYTFAVVYHYDEQGKPTWRSGSGSGGARAFSLSRSRGACPACDQQNAVYENAGGIDLAFASETHMTVSLETTDDSWDRTLAGHVMLSDPPSGRAHPAAMAYLASAEALRFFFRNAWQLGGSYAYAPICRPPIVSPAPPLPQAPPNGLVSQTNVQEAGVDESDMVKATEDHVFTIEFPAAWDLPEVPSEDGTTTERLQRIAQYRVSIDAGHPSLEKGYEVRFPYSLRGDWALSGQGIYHHVGNDGTARLLFHGSQTGYACRAHGPARSRLISWRVDAEGAPDPEVDLTFEGEIISTRRIGDQLFVLTTYRPDFHALTERVLPEDLIRESYTQEEFELILAMVDAEALLPHFTLADGAPRPLVAADRILLPPLPGERLMPHVNVLSMFDINDLSAPPESMAILGRTDGLYATPDSVWLASARPNLALNAGGQIERSGFTDTDLHRFAIEGDTLAYAGSGSVEGTIGSDPAQLGFRLSEWNGALRVLTDSPVWQERWGALGSNRLAVLATAAGDDLLLERRSVLPNAERPERIGKPGESVFAVRFFGDRGYVVTFQRIDPLYALDLSDPFDPYLLGGLEIPGYSDYLHPVDENLLLGVGMQAVETTANIVDPLPITVDLGVQIGLFDVSDPGAPVQLDRDIIGYRGSSTPVGDAYHAFTWLPGDPATGRPTRFAVPVIETGPVDGVEPWGHGEYPWYPWIQTGIVQYELARAGNDAWFERLGMAPVIHRDQVIGDAIGLFDNDDHPDALRSVIHTDRLMMSYRGGLYSGDWGFTAPLVPAEGCERCKLEGMKAD